MDKIARGRKERLTMAYWKGKRFWLGKLLEYPEIMTQGETLKDLEENLREAYTLLVLDDVPDGYKVKKLAVWDARRSSTTVAARFRSRRRRSG